jgi:hypothetical protein
VFYAENEILSMIYFTFFGGIEFNELSRWLYQDC